MAEALKVAKSDAVQSELLFELLDLLRAMEPAEIESLLQNLKVERDVKVARRHLSHVANDVIERHFDDFVTIDLDTGDWAHGKTRGASVATFEASYGSGRRRLTALFGSMG